MSRPLAYRTSKSARLAPIQIVFFAFTALAGWTWVEGDVGAGIAGRVTWGEVMGIAIIMAALLKLFLAQARPVIALPMQYKAALLLYLVFLISAAQGYNPSASLFELLVHVFIFTVSLALLVLAGQVTDAVLRGCLLGTLYGSGLIAAIGIAQFLFFPHWFSGAQGGLSGTFRNTGQAGAYFGMFLALFIPAFMSGYLRLNALRMVALLLLLVALVLTLKRSFLIGTLAGFSFALLGCLFTGRVSMVKRMGKAIVAALIGAAVLHAAFSFASGAVAGFDDRVGRKLRVTDLESLTEGFFEANLGYAIAAFSDAPLLGIGWANLREMTGFQYEIHGTWLALAGYVGLIGVLAGFIFFAVIGRALFRASARSADPALSAFLILLFFFYLGLLIGWLYTYPLRKREFWIFMSLVSMAIMLAQRRNTVSPSGGA